MYERLYQPDFSCIFGKKYANAFIYGQVDSLVWPIFNDVESSDLMKNLLKIKNKDGREYFYHRKLNISDEKVELNCANIDMALIQAMDLGRDYGISNSDVITVVKKDPNLFIGVLSYNLSDNVPEENTLSNLKILEKEIKIAGIALFPSYTKLNLTDENNNILKELLTYCKAKNYFIKIDIGNMFFPENYPEFVSYEKIKCFLSKNPENTFILSGLDITGDFNIYYQLLKYFTNLWIEIDPRSLGGMTPTDCFKQIFAIKGFIQNCWHRLIIGSATPTLEISQIIRGFLEASESLVFSQKCILRTWSFRNVNRLNPLVFKPMDDLDSDFFKTVLKVTQNEVMENENELSIIYKIKLRSYAITQLLFLTKLIKEIFDDALEKFPNLQYGDIFIRSYHTTTSLIINEHECGNYLDLHYKFAEKSKKDCSQFLHTVKALENEQILTITTMK